MKNKGKIVPSKIVFSGPLLGGIILFILGNMTIVIIVFLY